MIAPKRPPPKPQGKRRWFDKPRGKSFSGLRLQVKEGDHFIIEKDGISLKELIAHGGKTVALILDGPKDFVIQRSNRKTKDEF